jgi:hypothetical protein
MKSKLDSNKLPHRNILINAFGYLGRLSIVFIVVSGEVGSILQQSSTCNTHSKRQVTVIGDYKQTEFMIGEN